MRVLEHVRGGGLTALAYALVLGLPLGALGQTPPGSDPSLVAPATGRPGLVRIGAFYFTPYLRIGAMGIDTNVFYTPTDRQTDFSASGGPGLEVVLPIGERGRLRLDGGLNYVYFARTESQRRLNGYGSALFEVEGVKTRFAIQESYDQTYSRPSYEVDTRVRQETEGTRAYLWRRLGDRFSVGLFGDRNSTRTEDQAYLGTNLGTTLTEDRYDAGGELQTALSVKTRFVVGGEQSWSRFPRQDERNGDATLAYAGFRTDATALASGYALAGVRWYGLDASSEPRRDLVYADANATLNISPKTKLGGRFLRDFTYSAFATPGSAPTLLTERAEVFFDKVLVRNIYVRVFARQSRLISDGDVTLIIPGEGIVHQERNDRVREAGGELGYQFRPRVRIGVTASYTKRRSNIETFGIEGLLAGLTIQYNPPQPSFR